MLRRSTHSARYVIEIEKRGSKGEKEESWPLGIYR